MKIGSLTLTGPYMLAPMAGVSDKPFRVLCHEEGASLVCMEMVSANAIKYHNKKTEAFVDISPREHPVSMQLFGPDPETIALAAEALAARPFDVLDINMGCPMPKIVKNGEGSALMRDPKKAAAIVRAAVRVTDRPVTVKIRAGFNDREINAPELAKYLEDAGADAIIVHGRTREQHYSVTADWNIIAQVKRAVRVPVLGNGDVRCGRDALRMLEETGCDGVLVGRAAQGNPWIFRDIRAAMQGMPYQPPTPMERVEMMMRHFDLETQIHGEHRGMLEMRKHIAWYVHGLRGAAKFRDMIVALDSPQAIQQAITEFAQSQNDPAPSPSAEER